MHEDSQRRFPAAPFGYEYSVFAGDFGVLAIFGTFKYQGALANFGEA